MHKKTCLMKASFSLFRGQYLKKEKGAFLNVNPDKERQRTAIAFSVIFWVLIIAFIVVFILTVI